VNASKTRIIIRRWWDPDQLHFDLNKINKLDYKTTSESDAGDIVEDCKELLEKVVKLEEDNKRLVWGLGRLHQILMDFHYEIQKYSNEMLGQSSLTESDQ